MPCKAWVPMFVGSIIEIWFISTSIPSSMPKSCNKMEMDKKRNKGSISWKKIQVFLSHMVAQVQTCHCTSVKEKPTQRRLLSNTCAHSHLSLIKHLRLWWQTYSTAIFKHQKLDSLALVSPSPCQADLAKGGKKKKGIHIITKSSIPSYMALVQTCDCTRVKKKS